MDEELRAIADPTRRQILKLVWENEMTAGEVAVGFDISRPAISQHLRVLLDAELVAVRGEGTRRFYRANSKSLSALRIFVEEFWDESLTHLKQKTEREQKALDKNE